MPAPTAGGAGGSSHFHFILVRVTGVRDEKAVFPIFVNVAALAFGRVQFQAPRKGQFRLVASLYSLSAKSVKRAGRKLSEGMFAGWRANNNWPKGPQN